MLTNYIKRLTQKINVHSNIENVISQIGVPYFERKRFLYDFYRDQIQTQ